MNTNLLQKIDFLLTKKDEIESMLKNIRLDILKVNQDRLSLKDQKEAELFQKDMERMELKIEVNSLKQQV